MDIENWIYIIITAIVIITSIVGQNKKKAETQRSPVDPYPDYETEDDPFWDEEYDVNKEQPQPQPQPVRVTGQKPTSTLFTENKKEEKAYVVEDRNIDFYEAMKSKGENSLINSNFEGGRVTSSIKIDDNVELREIKQDFNEDLQNFDLRKAVIYSEIFNRKYF